VLEQYDKNNLLFFFSVISPMRNSRRFSNAAARNSTDCHSGVVTKSKDVPGSFNSHATHYILLIIITPCYCVHNCVTVVQTVHSYCVHREEKKVFNERFDRPVLRRTEDEGPLNRSKHTRIHTRIWKHCHLSSIFSSQQPNSRTALPYGPI